MSSAMVGQHVAALEEHLGTRLLNRTTRRQSLTDIGLSYVEQCRDILERVAAAQMQAEAQQQLPRGQLRITAPVTFGAEALMPVLGRYRELAPEVTLDIVLTDRNVDLVDEGFDIAFRIGTLPDSRLIARPLTTYRMIVAASPALLARWGAPGHPAELARFPGVLFAPGARSPWQLAQGDTRIEVAPEPAITVNSGQAVRNAGCAGLGVIVQPQMLLAPDIEAGRLVQLFADWQLGERPVSLLYQRDRRMTPRLRSFIHFAVSTLGPDEPSAAADGEA